MPADRDTDRHTETVITTILENALLTFKVLSSPKPAYLLV